MSSRRSGGAGDVDHVQAVEKSSGTARLDLLHKIRLLLAMIRASI